MTRKDFWRGYWPLAASFGVAQIGQQVDIVVMGRLGGEAQAAYVLLQRLAIPDMVMIMSLSAVASTSVAAALRSGEGPAVAGRVLILSLLLGVAFGVGGLFAYPRLARAVAGEGSVASMIDASVLWHALSAPARFFSSAALFILHALGAGTSAMRWKLIEAAARMCGYLLLLLALQASMAGCFAISAVIAFATSIWCVRALRMREMWSPRWPPIGWASGVLRASAWEAQRMASTQLALLTSLALFATPWFASYGLPRLAAYSSGQMLMMMVFLPFVTLMRFLPARLAQAPRDHDACDCPRALRDAAPLALGFAALLYASADGLGAIYGQSGVWWTTLIGALALSLPVRYAANIARSLLQSRGAFNVVAKSDSLGQWLLALPLVVIGLFLDSPHVAYSSLILPETAIAFWLWRRLAADSTAPRQLAPQIRAARR